MKETIGKDHPESIPNFNQKALVRKLEKFAFHDVNFKKRRIKEISMKIDSIESYCQEVAQPSSSFDEYVSTEHVFRASWESLPDCFEEQTQLLVSVQATMKRWVQFPQHLQEMCGDVFFLNDDEDEELVAIPPDLIQVLEVRTLTISHGDIDGFSREDSLGYCFDDSCDSTGVPNFFYENTIVDNSYEECDDEETDADSQADVFAANYSIDSADDLFYRLYESDLIAEREDDFSFDQDFVQKSHAAQMEKLFNAFQRSMRVRCLGETAINKTTSAIL